MSIRGKIVVAFGLLFLAAIGGMGWVAMRVAAEAVERQLTAQAENASRLFSNWNPPPVPAFVANVSRRVTGADAAVLDGGRWGSTLDAASRAAVEAAWQAGTLAPVPGAPRVVPWRLSDGRDSTAVCVAYRPSEANTLAGATPPPEGVLILLYPAAQVETEIARARRPFLLVLAGGLALVAILGMAIAHGITTPLARLVHRAREVGAGRLTDDRTPAAGGAGTGVHAPVPIPASGDEVAQLDASFDRMVEGLRHYQENLLRSEKLAVAGRMAAGIAHEIRNPLAAMRMTVELHLREELDAEHRQSLELLRTEIGRIEEAVGELMDIASPAAPRVEGVDLDAVVKDVLALVRPQVEHQGILVEARFAGSLCVRCDPRRLRRVVLNLVLNAIQALPDRGRLTVETKRRGKDIRLEVADTGPGIPEDLRGRIFDLFVSGKPGGAGLGLAMTRRIVEEQGGRIGFETGAGGTTFWVELAGD
jgi:signal transduction histidine kinase